MTERELQRLYGGDYLPQSEETQTALMCEEHEGEDIPIYDTDVEAIKMGIVIMHKYEKIEQILKDIPYGGEATVRRIQEVVEDGKID